MKILEKLLDLQLRAQSDLIAYQEFHELLDDHGIALLNTIRNLRAMLVTLMSEDLIDSIIEESMKDKFNDTDLKRIFHG